MSLKKKSKAPNEQTSLLDNSILPLFTGAAPIINPQAEQVQNTSFPKGTLINISKNHDITNSFDALQLYIVPEKKAFLLVAAELSMHTNPADLTVNVFQFFISDANNVTSNFLLQYIHGGTEDFSFLHFHPSIPLILNHNQSLRIFASNTNNGQLNYLIHFFGYEIDV